jgi:benzil reductase ((S)-benzoin forming)
MTTTMPMKAVLTGHSRGLGAALADTLLARNIPVLALARHGNTELGTRYPDTLEQVAVDLSDPNALTRWLASGALRSFLGGSETALLINNAGTVQPVGPIQTHDPSAIVRAIDLNVATPMILAAAFTAASPETSEKRIVHVSSGAARTAYPGWSVYCATKAALDQHARAAALDRVPGLRICSLAPGIVDTDMQAEIRATSAAQFPLREKFDALKRGGNLVSPADCASQLVDYLLHPAFGEDPVADLRDTAQ